MASIPWPIRTLTYWELLILKQSSFYIVEWVFFWKATCPKNPSLCKWKITLSFWLLLFKLEGAWILEKRLYFFMLSLFRTLNFVILKIHFFNFIYFGPHIKLTHDIWLISRWPYSVTQDGLKFMTVLLPQLPWCWDYRGITVANACSPRTPAHWSQSWVMMSRRLDQNRVQCLLL